MSQDAFEEETVATAAEDQSAVTSLPPSTPKRSEPSTSTVTVPEEGEEEESKEGLYPFTTPREEFFDKRTWWMVDLACVEDEAPNQGATPLVARCMRVHLWDEEHARRVLTAYKQFLILKTERKDWYGKELSPCADVERMWQLHIVDMSNYYHDCMLLCGHVINYNPDEAVDENAKSSHEKNTHVALKGKFGSKCDEDLWTNVGTPKPGMFQRQVAKAKSTKQI
mmetsp:Transcript_18045/g.23291  ORF Transcript_18045/g.23291 Transcript_18045/m.23291 type:complete len:224 (-) Transcript_18045:261-932(-)|eukprot:CAMPEP_0198140282 /NCGR_PEP_ID=MMETSP1443-20131203/3469_1 /TAXON_ID=186043 /ORGANISM="Entomoneis sp., Strain CCMP2396" /LENGTH=223 /DNA_ID=CAMNT_0043802655 /DNA_START=92 /DNA_END=763 /DNA_ORIENTATION=+